MIYTEGMVEGFQDMVNKTSYKLRLDCVRLINEIFCV